MLITGAYEIALGGVNVPRGLVVAAFLTRSDYGVWGPPAIVLIDRSRIVLHPTLPHVPIKRLLNSCQACLTPGVLAQARASMAVVEPNHKPESTTTP